MGTRPAISLVDPVLIEKIFIGNFRTFSDRSVSYIVVYACFKVISGRGGERREGGWE